MTFWSFLGVFIVIGLVIKYWWVLALGLVAFGAVKLLEANAQRRAMEAGRRQHQHALLRARADQHHDWAQCGDLRGTYGQYPPVSL